MIREKQLEKPSKNLTPKTNNSKLSTEDRLRAFANIIVERILEDQRNGVMEYKLEGNG